MSDSSDENSESNSDDDYNISNIKNKIQNLKDKMSNKKQIKTTKKKAVDYINYNKDFNGIFDFLCKNSNIKNDLFITCSSIWEGKLENI